MEATEVNLGEVCKASPLVGSYKCGDVGSEGLGYGGHMELVPEAGIEDCSALNNDRIYENGAEKKDLFEEQETSTLEFYVNGVKVVEKEVDPEMNLLSYLRFKLHLTGSKLGCGEGGCGACTVMVTRVGEHLDGGIRHWAANACLLPLACLHWTAITTIEGLGGRGTSLHPIQERMAASHASQCGFCTPGFIMSAYALLRTSPNPTMEEMEEALGGNLCRCTGYRPILEALRTFTIQDKEDDKQNELGEKTSKGPSKRPGKGSVEGFVEESVQGPSEGHFEGPVKEPGEGSGEEHVEKPIEVPGDSPGKGPDKRPGEGPREKIEKEFAKKISNKLSKEPFAKSVKESCCECQGKEEGEAAAHLARKDCVSEPNGITNGDQPAPRQDALSSTSCGVPRLTSDEKSHMERKQGNVMSCYEEREIENGKHQRPEDMVNGGEKSGMGEVERWVEKPWGSGGCGRKDCCQLGGKKATNGCEKPTTGGERSSKSGSNVMEVRSMTKVLYDRSKFCPYNPDQEAIVPPQLLLNRRPPPALVFRGPRTTFYEPSCLHQLLLLKLRLPSAKLLAGNTEIGVETSVKGQQYPTLVSVNRVEELRRITVGEKGVTVGASASLSRVQEVLKGALDGVSNIEGSKKRTIRALMEAMRWFAGKQIRNAATMGGSLVTASPIGDLAPILMASGATVLLASKAQAGSPTLQREVALDDSFFTGYRRTALRPEEVMVSIWIPFAREREFLFAFKQSRRRDDDIAIVNAGCRVLLAPEGPAVKEITLAFGGVAATPVLARNTMKVLEGLLWTPAIVEAATTSLLSEVVIPPSAPGGMAHYRTALLPSLFLKFYLSVRKELESCYPGTLLPLLTEEERVLASPYTNLPVSSTQLYQEISPGQPLIDPVGRPAPLVSAVQQVTGEAEYTDDLRTLAGELHVGLVMASEVNCDITELLLEEALLEPGVVGFLRTQDIPGSPLFGEISQDEELISSHPLFRGQVVGLVLGEDRGAAQRGAAKVRVHYGAQTKKPCYSIEEALETSDPPPGWGPWTIYRGGDVEEALRAAPHVLRGQIRIGGQEHFYLEPHAALAVPHERGLMEVFSSTQHPSGVQHLVAETLGVPHSHVTCRARRLGGGFGGKQSRAGHVAALAALGAAKFRRPVRLVLSRHEDMMLTGGRHPSLCRWEVGVGEEGELRAIRASFYLNGGCSMDFSTLVLQKALYNIDGPYRCPVVHVSGFACRTSLPSNTAFRGFGSPQGMIVAEDIVSRVADHLGLDPMKVRERNLYSEGDKTHMGQTLEHCSLRRCWDEALRQADVGTMRDRVDSFNRKNRYRKRGMAAVPTKFGIAYELPFLNQAGALVLVYKDGSVLLSHGGVEMGQGLHTKMAQVAARVLGVSLDEVLITETTTDKVPNTSATAASVSSDINGMAVKNACEKINRRLEPIKKRLPGANWKKWVQEAFVSTVSLAATGFYYTPDLVEYDFDRQEGRPFNYYSYGAAVSEVEVDCLTGDHTVLRTDIVMDVGCPLNPALDIGQVEGGFLQGYGLFTLEELRYSPRGDLLTKGPGAYKIPGAQDIPREFNVTLLRDSPNPRAVFASKAVGEPPLFLAASVFHAIRNAVLAARADSSTTVCSVADSSTTVSNGADTRIASTNGRTTDSTLGAYNATDSTASTDSDTDSSSSRTAGNSGNDQGTETGFRFDAPATVERIRLACLDSITHKVEAVMKEGPQSPWSITV